MRLCSYRCILLFFCFAFGILWGQPDRLKGRIDRSRTAQLPFYIPDDARRAPDRGPLPPGIELKGLVLHLKRSAAQQQSLEQLLADQQNPNSVNYHRWLTPDEFADRFGVSDHDIRGIEAWLRSEGFTVSGRNQSRTLVAFSGPVQRASAAFGANLRRFSINGVDRFANIAAPVIPAELADVVQSIGGLDDIPETGSIVRFNPNLTQPNGRHDLAPDDLAVIYNIAPLYRTGIDGTGQKIVVIGNTEVDTADLQAFRRKFNLPAQNFQSVLVPTGADPGLNRTTLPEADLDIEWAGAVARNATIVYVYSNSIVNAIQYAIDLNLAPVITSSFSRGCEVQVGLVAAQYQALAQQANAQGITWVNSAGDAGPAGCDGNGTAVAQNGRAVRIPASIPEVTGVGGTQFDDGNGNYWMAANDANSASAISYIPESTWNAVSSRNQLLASGGGSSILFPKPAWQTGAGFPAENARSVPDVALAASSDHVAYYTVSGGNIGYFGGTSASTPVFAGILVLANQYLVSKGTLSKAGLGNVNPALYRIAQNVPEAFHDITKGDNIVPCAAGSPQCTAGSFGFSATAGYDQATGLGSPDAARLVQQWSSQPAQKAAVTVSVSPNPVYQRPPDSQGIQWSITIRVHENAGISATVTDLVIDGVSYAGQLSTFFSSTNIPANGTIRTDIGSRSINVPTVRSFIFRGTDANGNAWTAQTEVPFYGLTPTPTIAGVSNAASGRQEFAPGMLVSVYGTNFSTVTQAAAAIPLLTYMGGFAATVNGVPAPIHSVSPKQVNIQIPYETQSGLATLALSNGLAAATTTFQVAASAPGIFGGSASPQGSRGQILTIFITGEGQVTPSVATGATPAAGLFPAPQLPVSLTIGGMRAELPFVGIPTGLVGVTQINFQVPATAPLGVQPLIVTVGESSSAPVNFTVNP